MPVGEITRRVSSASWKRLPSPMSLHVAPSSSHLHTVGLKEALGERGVVWRAHGSRTGKRPSFVWLFVRPKFQHDRRPQVMVLLNQARGLPECLEREVVDPRGQSQRHRLSPKPMPVSNRSPRGPKYPTTGWLGFHHEESYLWLWVDTLHLRTFGQGLPGRIPEKCGEASHHGSKIHKYGVCMVSIPGIVPMILAIYSVFGYLNP